MVTDQEPRYRLVDSNGDIVGTLFAESDGTLKLQEGTSGSENELTFGTDGTVDQNQISVDGNNFVGESDVLPIACFLSGSQTSASTTSTSYTDERDVFQSRMPFGEIVPDGATLAVNLTLTALPGSGETYDIRLQNVDDSNTLLETTDANGKFSTGFTAYSNFNTGTPKTVRLQHRTNPGSNSSELLYPTVWFGLQF